MQRVLHRHWQTCGNQVQLSKMPMSLCFCIAKNVKAPIPNSLLQSKETDRLQRSTLNLSANAPALFLKPDQIKIENGIFTAFNRNSCYSGRYAFISSKRCRKYFFSFSDRVSIHSWVKRFTTGYSGSLYCVIRWHRRCIPGNMSDCQNGYAIVALK